MVVIAALVRTVSLSDIFLEMATRSFRRHSHCLVISIVLLAYSSSIDVSALATTLHIRCRSGSAHFSIMILSINT